MLCIDEVEGVGGSIAAERDPTDAEAEAQAVQAELLESLGTVRTCTTETHHSLADAAQDTSA